MRNISSALFGLPAGTSWLFFAGLAGCATPCPTEAQLETPQQTIATFRDALACDSAVNVEYRDVRYTIPFLVQLWLFATPVAYSSSLVPEAWRPWLPVAA